MKIYVCWRSDVEQEIERLLSYGKTEEAARTAHGLEAGKRVVESWVLRSHGRLIEDAGAAGSLEVEAEHLSELSDVVEQVEQAVGSRVQVGVGAEPGEAMVARRVAEERGGSPAVVLYTPDLQDEVKELDELSDDDADAVEEEPPEDLGKAEGENQREPGEASQVAQGQLSPSAAAPSAPSATPVSAPSASPQQPGQPQQPPQGGEPSEEQVLQEVGKVLQLFQQQVPVYEQMKQAAPQAYEAVMGMVQGMVAMAKLLAGGGPQEAPPQGAAQQVQKSEDADLVKGESEQSKSDQESQDQSPMEKAAPQPASRRHLVLPAGSHGVGSRARSVKVVEPATGKVGWHQVSTGQTMSGDGHSVSTRVKECPKADTPEHRASAAGLGPAPEPEGPA